MSWHIETIFGPIGPYTPERIKEINDAYYQNYGPGSKRGRESNTNENSSKNQPQQPARQLTETPSPPRRPSNPPRQPSNPPRRPSNPPTSVNGSDYYGPGGAGDGSGRGQAQQTSRDGINPRTNQPWSVTPGKATTEEGATLVDQGTPEETPTQEPEVTPKSEPTASGRDVERNGAKGTQTSPSAFKPESFDAVAARIMAANPGVRFNQDYQFQNENSGSQSNSLPTTAGYDPNETESITLSTGLEAGKTVYKSDGPYADVTKGAPNVNTRNIKTGKGDDQSLYEVDYFTGKPIAEGAQRGDSNAADAGDRQNQITSGRLGKALDSVEAYDSSKYKGDKEDPTMKRLLAQATTRDRRTQAFAAGSDDSLMALKAADLAQGTIKSGNDYYGRGKDGEMVKLNSEAVDALKADRNAVASQAFLKNYMSKPATPADQQSPDSEQPVPASTATIGQISQQDMPGTTFFETDATKIDGISGATENPNEIDTSIMAPLTQAYEMRADVSEPAHSWGKTEYELPEGGADFPTDKFLNSDREPLMRFNLLFDKTDD